MDKWQCEKRAGCQLFFTFHSRKIAVLCYWVKNGKLLWYNSVDAIALVGTVFCRSNRKQRKGASAYENADRIYLPFGTCA